MLNAIPLILEQLALKALWAGALSSPSSKPIIRNPRRPVSQVKSPDPMYGGRMKAEDKALEEGVGD